MKLFMKKHWKCSWRDTILKILRHIWLYGKLMVSFNEPIQKLAKKNLFKLSGSWILMAANIVTQIGRVQTFFVWKYLILSHFLAFKTPTEDSILGHWRDCILHFLICMSIYMEKKIQGGFCRILMINGFLKWISFDSITRFYN